MTCATCRAGSPPRSARGLSVLTWTVATAALRQRALEHADAWICEAEGVATAPANA
jgi:hypothetical protein